MVWQTIGQLLFYNTVCVHDLLHTFQSESKYTNTSMFIAFKCKHIMHQHTKMEEKYTKSIAGHSSLTCCQLIIQLQRSAALETLAFIFFTGSFLCLPLCFNISYNMSASLIDLFMFGHIYWESSFKLVYKNVKFNFFDNGYTTQVVENWFYKISNYLTRKKTCSTVFQYKTAFNEKLCFTISLLYTRQVFI